MYGINRRDRYKNSKWSQKSKSELDITSESEYEDSKTEKSYSEKTEKIDKPIFNDLKIIESLNEIKETSKNKLDKVDNLLEYRKSIDSDAKNTFELLKTIESKANTDHIELKTLIGNLSNGVLKLLKVWHFRSFKGIMEMTSYFYNLRMVINNTENY